MSRFVPTLSAMGVDVTNRGDRRSLAVGRLKKTAQKILELVDQRKAELSVVLVDNREIQRLNARYRYKNEPTDVLSFPAGRDIPGGLEVLGDVVISVEKAAEQARKRRKTIEQEMEKLLIHGILHLLGYDHERSKKDAKVMRALEKKVFRGLERFVRSRS